MKKSAFTMIELIFAIVIIGISALSLPMMTQASSSGVAINIETQEAIFKAIVKTKEAITESTFATIDNYQKTNKTQITDSVGLTEYKFNQKYTLSVTASATFNGQSNADIKKIETKIYREDNSHLATFIAYKFNY